MKALKISVKKNFGRWLYRHKTASARKAELEENSRKQVNALPEAAFDIFTDQGEDGIISYLIQHLREVPRYFVDIGAGDCIRSNCATLAVHFGWRGVFIDRDKEQLSIGKHFYREQVEPGKISFVNDSVNPGNVNSLLLAAGVPPDLGLLSIDIDGNDFWVWNAISCINPHIVVIEAKVEFGERNIVVPYSQDNHSASNKMYNGASVQALRKLGKEKGYTLAGANKFGYNLFFVQEDKGFTEADTPSILSDPATKNSFYPDSFFTKHVFEKA